MFKFKHVTIVIAAIFTFFVLAVVLGIVVKSSPQSLLSNIQSEEIRFAFFMGLITAIISTVLCLVVSIPTAYAIARYRFFGGRMAKIILDLPIAFPPIVAGLGLLILFTSSFGVALEDMGLKFVFSPAGIVLAQFFVNAPYTTRILTSSFSEIDPRYELVAQTLGKTPFEAFSKVTLPMARAGVIGSTVITWARGMAEFGAVLIFAGAIAEKTETLPIALFLNLSCGNIDGAIASATILIVISLLALCIFERFGGGRF
ncbi:molybdate ABC transporter permease subunit [ANME-1 cluster archaeon GoMg4]|nr:molybdate ABC transporter permease subunit [ANME-1 cluster archaeon GoMg4]